MVNRESGIKTAKAFIEECNSIGLNFYKVMMFGSVAKNQAHEWSDIDLLLISDQFGQNLFENLKLYSRINIKYPQIETHPYPTYYYLEGDSFLSEISQQGIEIK